MDLDGDGRKDLLVGNTNGAILLYPNRESDAAPGFSTYDDVTADGVPLDLPGVPRSRPFITDWTGDGLPDLLVGAGDGRVHLFQSVPEPVSLSLLAVAGIVLLWSKRKRGNHGTGWNLRACLNRPDATSKGLCEKQESTKL